MKALLLSGGLDSSALAHWLRPDICVTIDYGQRAARGEAAASTALCGQLGLRHRLITVDLSSLGSGSMAHQAPAAAALADEFWPYRNQLLVTLAAMQLLPEGLSAIYVGAVSTDVHADSRSSFFSTLDRLVRRQEGGVRVSAPARKMDTATLLRRSAFPRALIGLTFSCHVHEYACGQCGGCRKHRDVIDEVYGSLSAGLSAA